MKQKYKKILKQITIIALYITIIILYIYISIYNHIDFIKFKDLSYPSTYIENTDISSMSYEEVKEIIDKKIESALSKEIYLSGSIVLKFKLNDIVLNTNKEKILHNLINNKDLSIGQRFIRYLLNKKNNYKITYTYDINKINNIENIMSIDNYKINKKELYNTIQNGSGIIIYTEKKPIMQDYVEKNKNLKDLKDVHLIFIDNFIRKQIYIDFKKTDLISGDKIDYNKLNDYLHKITKHLNKKKIDGKITLNENNKIIFSDNIKNGKEVDIYNLINLINYAQTSTSSYIIIPTKEIKAEIEIDENLKQRGIKTLLATGISDFSGSPKERMHNIKIGAAKYNGIIISSGSIFSFNKYLGKVNSKNGFVESIVIKTGKNEREYGGGLCQVSTTLYRMALIAGFDIVKRKNHQYMVNYYYPPGTDATIYPPSLDFQFLNNTNNDILIQSFIEYPYVYFNVFGTNTNKKIYMKGPYTYGYRKPPPPQYFKTTAYPRGVTVQLDEEHYGLSSDWYRIIYQNGIKIKEEKIQSKYVPWAAKFYTGI